jgi:hypothetical protein
VWKGKKYVLYFGRETEGKRSLGRPRHREEDDIKIDIKELGWEGVERINLAVCVSLVVVI